jgi:hypothetical protein
VHLNSDHTTTRPPSRSPFRRYEALIIAALAIGAFALSCWGFTEYFRDDALPVSVFEVLYRSLRLFVLHGDPFDEPIPWPLQVGRFLAPAATMVTAIAALGGLLRHQFQLVGVRVLGPQVVVCGLGRKGVQLVRDLRADHKRVVAIESDEKNEHISICRDLGAMVVVGNAGEVDVLRRAGADRVEQVFAAFGDDGANVEVAVHLRELRRELTRKNPRPLDCRVHIVDPMLCETLHVHGMFREAGSGFAAHVSNIFENSARALLEAHPLDRVPIGPDDPRTVHLLIVGFGKMGQAVALQAAKIGHFANGKRMRITVVDRDADARQRAFLARYAQFTRVCDTEFVKAEFESLEFFERLRKWDAAKDTLSLIAICLDDDAASLKCALLLSSQLGETDAPFFIRMQEATGLSALLARGSGATPLLRHAHAFGQIDVAASLPRWLRPDQDKFAKAAHEGFGRVRDAAASPAADYSKVAWDELPAWLRDSNRQFADHAPVKLRAIGCRIDGEGAGASVATFTDTESGVMARMEHSRWCGERYLAGWRQGDYDEVHKVSPHLADWHELRPEIRKCDHQMVQLIPQLLARIQKRIVRAGEAPSAGNPTPGGKRA